VSTLSNSVAVEQVARGVRGRHGRCWNSPQAEIRTSRQLSYPALASVLLATGLRLSSVSFDHDLYIARCMRIHQRSIESATRSGPCGVA